MKTNIYLSFSKGTSIISKIIMWFTKGRASHAAILYDNDVWGDMWVAEATRKGVYTYPLKKDESWAYVFRINYDIANDLHEASKYFEAYYNFEGLLVFGWILLWWRLLKVKIHKPHLSLKSQFCSEFSARCVKKALDGKDPQWISPEQLLEVAEAKTDLFIKSSL